MTLRPSIESVTGGAAATVEVPGDEGDAVAEAFTSEVDSGAASGCDGSSLSASIGAPDDPPPRRYDGRVNANSADDEVLDPAAPPVAGSGGPGDESLVPVCLRCFGPLEGAPTNCPTCAAPASRAALLGPSIVGGVDVGGTSISTLPRDRSGSLTPWAIVLVWGGGLIVLPSLFVLLQLVLPIANDPGDAGGRATLWVAIFVTWTLVLALRFMRAARRALREGAPDGTPGVD